jgi:hypothetical protein
MERAEYTSDKNKREVLHTLLISFNLVRFCAQTAFMHTSSP